jgi:hypothetical protein
MAIAERENGEHHLYAGDGRGGVRGLLDVCFTNGTQCGIGRCIEVESSSPCGERMPKPATLDDVVVTLKDLLIFQILAAGYSGDEARIVAAVGKDRVNRITAVLARSPTRKRSK